MAGAEDSVVNEFIYAVGKSLTLWLVYLALAWVIAEITGFSYDRSMLTLLLMWMAEENLRRTRS